MIKDNYNNLLTQNEINMFIKYIKVYEIMEQKFIEYINEHYKEYGFKPSLISSFIFTNNSYQIKTIEFEKLGEVEDKEFNFIIHERVYKIEGNKLKSYQEMNTNFKKSDDYDYQDIIVFYYSALLSNLKKCANRKFLNDLFEHLTPFIK